MVMWGRTGKWHGPVLTMTTCFVVAEVGQGDVQQLHGQVRQGPGERPPPQLLIIRSSENCLRSSPDARAA